MSNDDVVPLYCVKQKFGRFKVFIVLQQKNGYRSCEDKLISVFSNKKDAQMFINKKQGW
jgi:hypothetical protein